MGKLVFVDVESTSLDVRFGDLWEIATIVRDSNQPQYGDQESWWQVRPDLRLADPKSLQVSRYYERAVVSSRPVGHGVFLATEDWTDDDPYGHSVKKGTTITTSTSGDIASTLARQFNGATIVANNPRFDWGFIEKFLRRNGQLLTASHRTIDIRTLAIGYVTGRLHGRVLAEEFAHTPEAIPHLADWLEGVSDYVDWQALGVPRQKSEDQHTALGDTRLNRDVYDAVMGRLAA